MRYEEKPQITEQEIREAMDFSTAQVKRNLPEFTTKFQKAYSENGFYAPTDNVDWTTGFWTGEIWLSYEDTGKDIYKKAGEIQIDSFLNRIENKIEVDHHDMGFLYSPSCVAGYKLTGNETGRKAAILAADQLIRRFHPVGNFIQAWGAMDAPENYRLIIDCLLNLPLLYWASEETGDPKYRDIAEKHIHTAVANVIREDHSCLLYTSHSVRSQNVHRSVFLPVRTDYGRVGTFPDSGTHRIYLSAEILCRGNCIYRFKGLRPKVCNKAVTQKEIVCVTALFYSTGITCWINIT